MTDGESKVREAAAFVQGYICGKRRCPQQLLRSMRTAAYVFSGLPCPLMELAELTEQTWRLWQEFIRPPRKRGATRVRVSAVRKGTSTAKGI